MASRKQQRVMILVFGAVVLALSAVLVSLAMRDSIVFFYGPGEFQKRLAAGEITPDRRLRLGGLVETGSLKRGEGETASFVIGDGAAQTPVRYTGVLPDLFAEGQGAVAEGYYRNGAFEAVSVLAKHDENYMPREVADELKKTGRWKETEKTIPTSTQEPLKSIPLSEDEVKNIRKDIGIEKTINP